MVSVQLVLLGGFQAFAGDQEIEIPGRKERALLALLAVSVGRAQARDKLAGLLWSDRADKQARDSLKQAVFKLRRSLDGVQPSPLRTDRDALSLEQAVVAVDVAEFEKLIRDGTTESLARATALYRGDFLDNLDLRDAVFDEWLATERQRLRGLASGALGKLLDRYRADAAHEAAASIARRLLALDPLHEAAHRALMEIHVAHGQAAMALKQYQVCRETLHRELGVTPEPETERLRLAIQNKRNAPTPRAPESRSAVQHAAIAVLPFDNLSADPQQQYLGDGIAEDIITELSRYRSLVVIARNSSFQFRGPDSPKAVDLAAVRHKLGAQFVAEGSLRRIGTQLRLAVQLIDTATEAHIWAERYDCGVSDVFRVQDEMTRAIAATLEGRVAASGAEQARRRPTQDWAAYDYFLQGRERYHRYAFAEAEPYFAKAVALDPSYAQGHAFWAHTLLGKYWRDPDPALKQAAADSAQTALVLDDADPFCHATQGFVLTHQGRRDQAGAYFDRALALNPGHVQIATKQAWWLARVGRSAEALTKLDAIRQRDPFPPNWFWEVRAIALLVERRYGDAIDALARMTHRHAWDHAYLAACLSYLGRPDEARVAATEALAIDPLFTLSRYALVEGYTLPRELAHLLGGMRRAGIPE